MSEPFLRAIGPKRNVKCGYSCPLAPRARALGKAIGARARALAWAARAVWVSVDNFVRACKVFLSVALAGGIGAVVIVTKVVG